MCTCTGIGDSWHLIYDCVVAQRIINKTILQWNKQVICTFTDRKNTFFTLSHYSVFAWLKKRSTVYNDNSPISIFWFSDQTQQQSKRAPGKTTNIWMITQPEYRSKV